MQNDWIPKKSHIYLVSSNFKQDLIVYSPNQDESVPRMRKTFESARQCSLHDCRAASFLGHYRHFCRVYKRGLQVSYLQIFPYQEGPLTLVPLKLVHQNTAQKQSSMFQTYKMHITLSLYTQQLQTKIKIKSSGIHFLG